jgi:hypothetical protein
MRVLVQRLDRIGNDRIAGLHGAPEHGNAEERTNAKGAETNK